MDHNIPHDFEDGVGLWQRDIDNWQNTAQNNLITLYFDVQRLGVHYCPGYVDKNNTWKNGFYCSPQTKKIYCCGTPFHKYCCTEKELNGGKFGVPSSVSSSTLVTVVVITFFVAVFATVCMFVVCKRYWKRSVEIRETRLYRMSSNFPSPRNGSSGQNANTISTLDPSTLANNSRYTLVPTNAYESYIPMNEGNERNNRITIVEPPPPYHISSSHNHNQTLTGNSSNNNPRLFSVPCRRDTVFPCDGRKRLWRTLSQ